jgi:protoporphyrinogen oxidase
MGQMQTAPTPIAPSSTEVLVIGAGPAGLTAAYLLAKAGRRVIVVERDPENVGGISRTVNYKGFLFDIGGHRFFSKSKEVVDLWNEILPNDFLDRPRSSRIFYGGKYYSYPLKAFEALGNLGVLTSAACVSSFLWAKASPTRDVKTFHNWVRNQFGEKLFSIFFRTYTEKVWGMSCDEISADWAAQRIKGLDLGAAITDALCRSLGLKRKASGDPTAALTTLIESFRYPARGPGMMWEAAARKVTLLGGEIRMGRDLAHLQWDADLGAWRAGVVTAEGELEAVSARHVISSAALNELSAALSPKPRSDAAAQSLRYRDFITVALIARAESTFADNWVYIHDPSVKVGRIQNFLSWSPHMAPKGYACLGLEYFCFEGDGLWNASDAELIDLAKQEIGRIGLMNPSEVVDAAVVRQPKAYPVYDDSYQDYVNAIRKDYELNYPTLHLVGRNGMHKYNNQDHAMMTAMLTAANILAGERLYDVWQVNEEAEYTEAGYSGLQEALKSERLVPRRVQIRA